MRLWSVLSWHQNCYHCSQKLMSRDGCTSAVFVGTIVPLVELPVGQYVSKASLPSCQSRQECPRLEDSFALWPSGKSWEYSWFKEWSEGANTIFSFIVASPTYLNGMTRCQFAPLSSQFCLANGGTWCFLNKIHRGTTKIPIKCRLSHGYSYEIFLVFLSFLSSWTAKSSKIMAKLRSPSFMTLKNKV